MSSTASRIATVGFSAGAIVLLAIVAGSRACAPVGREQPSSYRTQTAPFAAGAVEGRLVLGSGGAIATARPGCEVPPESAVVWIDGPREGAPPPPETQLRLGECGFRPRLAVAMAESTVAIRASRAHRVQAWLDGVRVFDAAEGGDAGVRLVGPGVWQIRCAAGHPGEEAWIIATENPYATVVGQDGAFRLASVPVGTWSIHAWHPARGARGAPIDVAAKGATRLELTLPR